MRTGRTALPAILIATLAGGPALGDEATGPPSRKTFREAFRTFVRDGRYLVTFPSRARARDAWISAAVVAATALAVNRDDEVRNEVLESDSRTGHGRAASTAATAFESYLWATIVTSAAKGAFVAYPIAALVGWSTIQEDRHWASDIVAGAGLGLAIGRGIASRHPAPPRRIPGEPRRPPDRPERSARHGTWSLAPTERRCASPSAG